MNLLISAFQEPRWRRRLVTAPALRPGDAALDVATGTGKVAADLHARVAPFGRVLGVDLSPGMIGVAQARYRGRPGLDFVVGDALALPTEDATFDAATIAFGMRNLPDYRRGFEELARSVRPGGRVLCLEIARPRIAARAVHALVVRPDRPGDRPARGPGRRVRLSREVRPGLPVAGADRRDHGARPASSTSAGRA